MSLTGLLLLLLQGLLFSGGREIEQDNESNGGIWEVFKDMEVMGFREARF